MLCGLKDARHLDEVVGSSLALRAEYSFKYVTYARKVAKSFLYMVWSVAERAPILRELGRRPVLVRFAYLELLYERIEIPAQNLALKRAQKTRYVHRCRMG